MNRLDIDLPLRGQLRQNSLATYIAARNPRQFRRSHAKASAGRILMCVILAVLAWALLVEITR